MSSTNRGSLRREADYYPTPAWCTRSLIQAIRPTLTTKDLDGVWLEPCVGDGAIISAVESVLPGITWDTIDIRDTRKALDRSSASALVQEFRCGDFLETKPRKPYRLIISNPPFLEARAFVEHALRCAHRVIMLLRISWLSSQKRHDLFLKHPPHVRVLPHRPSFTGDGKTDSADYAWMDWRGSSGGRLSWLPLVPREERRR